MTKSEWYSYWRSVRVNAPKKSITSGDMVKALKELYDISLSDPDQAKYDLIDKYAGKVSVRLIRERELLHEKGNRQAKELWKSLIYSENPFLKMIPSEDKFKGCSYYLPVHYK